MAVFQNTWELKFMRIIYQSCNHNPDANVGLHFGILSIHQNLINFLMLVHDVLEATRNHTHCLYHVSATARFHRTSYIIDITKSLCR